ncbi:hypothetical protein ACFFGH_28200 [Lysobacter korlensis]|uniref:Uncharacterized protein n=1 Tax=Lysobacter korlensis TaxID=553636 RepID=A0ABV6RXN0_9GAMM
MTGTRPTIDTILTEFFAAELEGKRGITRERIEFVDVSLRHFLEAAGEQVLVADDLILLATEREFEPEGAFARTMHADDLIFALAGYLNSMVPREPMVLRVQLRMVDRLIGWMLGRHLVNHDELVTPLMHARAAIDSGRARLRHPAFRDV